MVSDTASEQRKGVFDCSGRVALVTGGAGYLGRAFCEALAAYGARVAIASRHADVCSALAAELGAEHTGWRLDLDSHEMIDEVVDGVADRYGRLDILVNNGYGGTLPSIEEATAEDFEASLRRGLTGYFLAARRAHGHMVRQGGGSVINIASMYGMVASYPQAYEGLPFGSPPNYHATKGGLIHLTRHLAVYWAKDKVRVNSLSPGPFPRPEIREKEDGVEFLGRLCDRVPMGRMGRPEELQGAMLLLASKAGSYITGQNLVVDGGWTAW
jgi:gluconate 5-dehydrogenase